MPKLKPLRDYSEHDVLPFYAYSGNFPVAQGTFVKIQGSGYVGQDLDIIGTAGASYNNVVSDRWGVNPKVSVVNATGDKVVGMLLYDGKELDENGEQLKFNPRKAREMNVFLSGWAAPIVTEGVFHYSGISGTFSAGDSLYVSVTDGGLTTSGPASLKVAQALGGANANGFALIRVSIP